jgi:hypothetical protein
MLPWQGSSLTPISKSAFVEGSWTQTSELELELELMKAHMTRRMTHKPVLRVEVGAYALEF